MMGIFFLIVGIYGLFLAYQAFKYRRLYWLYPSIIGFKKRKEGVNQRTIPKIIGVYLFLISIIMFFFAYRLL